MQQKGLEIIGHMRAFTDAKAKETKMNYTLLATPAEGLSGRFLRMDQKRYGKIPGVTDREYYTNSFHIPVWYPISAYEKIRKEAPYHAPVSYTHLDVYKRQRYNTVKASIDYSGWSAGLSYNYIFHVNYLQKMIMLLLYRKYQEFTI